MDWGTELWVSLLTVYLIIGTKKGTKRSVVHFSGFILLPIMSFCNEIFSLWSAVFLREKVLNF